MILAVIFVKSISHGIVVMMVIVFMAMRDLNLDRTVGFLQAGRRKNTGQGENENS